MAAVTASVGLVLTALAAYELLVLGPAEGVSARDTAATYLFAGGTAAVAGGVAAAITSQGSGAGLSVVGVFTGTASGTAAAAVLAMATGNGPDEGDGFFWLVVASLVVSAVAAVVAMAVSTVLARGADRPRG